MIKNIELRNVAAFDATGIKIESLKKINIFYGANGSGKTTISSFFQSPEDRRFTDCSIEWNGDSPLEVLVYNKTFREQNFNANNPKIAGVFTLGNATIEQKREIESKQMRLDEIKKEDEQKKKTNGNLINEKEQVFEDFCNTCWEQIRHKYNPFKEAFRGFLNDKKKFAQKVIDEYHHNTAMLHTIDEINHKVKILFASSPVSLNLLTIGDHSFTSIESDKIWEKHIVGKSDIEIASLIEKLHMNDWVNQGRQYIQSDLEVCPFCQKNTIDNAFKKQIEDYFDETFIQNTNRIKELSRIYASLSVSLIKNFYDIIEREGTNKHTKLDVATMKVLVGTLESQYNRNVETINNKIKEPSRAIELVSTKECLQQIIDLITTANSKIKEHNTLVENFQTEKNNLVAEIWKYIVEEKKTFIEQYIKKDDGLSKGITVLNKKLNELREQFKLLNKEIIEDRKNVTSVQPAVDEINRILSLYGFTNFSIVPTDDNCYQIKRENGEIAQNSLSEGEITFITFLYYMQLVHGGTSAENVNENKVLIIDDPISSLDGTILFVVSSLIKEEIKAVKKEVTNVKQIVLLTHNIYFHKEVSFIDGRTKVNDDTWFWIIRKKSNVSSIQCFEKNNPIRGSYELLWDELKNCNKLSNITVQNTMRRIYETYFRILGKFSDEEVLEKIDNPQDKEICRSLLCWINDGSHCIPDDLHIGYQEDNREKYLHVFKLIFEKMGHIEHYNMMMETN